MNPGSQRPRIISGTLSALSKKYVEEVRKVGLSLDLKDEQNLAGGNGIRSEGRWVEKRKEGSLANIKKWKEIGKTMSQKLKGEKWEMSLEGRAKARSVWAFQDV